MNLTKVTAGVNEQVPAINSQSTVQLLSGAVAQPGAAGQAKAAQTVQSKVSSLQKSKVLAAEPSLGELAGCDNPSVVQPDGLIYHTDFTDSQKYPPGDFKTGSAPDGWRAGGKAEFVNGQPTGNMIYTQIYAAGVSDDGVPYTQYLRPTSHGGGAQLASLRPANENCKQQYVAIDINPSPTPTVERVYVVARQAECLGVEPASVEDQNICMSNYVLGYQSDGFRMKIITPKASGSSFNNDLLTAGGFSYPYNSSHAYTLDLFVEEVSEGTHLTGRLFDKTDHRVTGSVEWTVAADDARRQQLNRSGSSGTTSGGAGALP
ncbi:MAG: hypothetical protein LBG70_01550, partial [Bifidobacteriaceae bacterium]|nr:hypothetical protein [Bifidobacteriaceae bacterium]